jgi:hypothetical protein
MVVSASKGQFLTNVQILGNTLEAARVLSEQLVNMYFNAGFNSGGSNPIIDADGTSYGLTPAEVAAEISVAQALANFFGNASVATGNRQIINDAVRTN